MMTMAAGDFHSDRVAWAAASELLGREPDEIVAVNPGFSGGTVARCDCDGGQFALKRWSPGTWASRVDAIHELQNHACRTLTWLPKLKKTSAEKSRFTIGDAHFEMSTWLPGSAIPAPGESSLPVDAIYNAVFQGASAIARFHESLSSFCPDDAVASQVAPAVIRRVDRLAELKSLVPKAINRSHFASETLRRAASTLANWPSLHRAAVYTLSRWLHRPLATVWAHGDPHREHILFAGGEVVGMVDLDAIKRDNAASDLARWIGSFRGFGIDSTALAQAASAGYRLQRPFDTQAEELVKALESASWYIQLANWVVWVELEQRKFPGEMAAVDRHVAFLLRSIGVSQVS